MDASTSAAGLASLNRFDFTTDVWDQVIAVLERHGFHVAPQEPTGRNPEPLWLVTSSRAAGITLLADTPLLYFAMGLAAAEEHPAAE